MQEVTIVSGHGTSARRAKVTDQQEILVKVNNSNDSPVITVPTTSQSDALNIASSTTGTFDSPCSYIMNTGSTDILINGATIGAGLSFEWHGSFTYDSQSSTILIIYTV